MKLHVWHWPAQEARGVVALIHGAGEHGKRYEAVAADWNRAGYAVLGVDLPGHGLSEGPRGHIDRFDRYLDAVDTTFQEITALYAGFPVILFGHSMGGLIAVRYVQTRGLPDSIQAIILTSPCLDLSLRVPPMKVRLAKLLRRIYPSFRQPAGILPSNVSRASDIVDAYANDPYIVRSVSVNWFLELDSAMRAAREQGTTFPVPTLILQAGSDHIVSSAATERFAHDLMAPRKDFRLYPACYHELLNEPERHEIFSDILDWLTHNPQ